MSFLSSWHYLLGWVDWSKLLGVRESRRRFRRYEVYDDQLFSVRDAPSMHMTIHALRPADVSGRPPLYFIDDRFPATMTAIRLLGMLMCYLEWLGTAARS